MKRFFATIISLAILISIAVPASVNAAAAKPSDLQQISAGETSVKFSWSPVFGKEVSYEVQMGYSQNDLTTVRDKDDWYSSDTEYSADSLNAGKSYYARVRAYADDSYSQWSDVLELVTVPKAVEGFVQTDCTETTATFKWNASEGATSYRVIEGFDNQKLLGTTTGTSFTIKGYKNTVQPKNAIYIIPVRASSSYSAYAKSVYSWDVEEINAYDIRLTPKKMNAPTVRTIYNSLNICDFSTQTVPFCDEVQYEAYNANGKKVFSGFSGSPSLYGTHGSEFYSIRVRAVAKIGATITKYGAWSDKKYFGYNLNMSAKKVNKKKAVKANWKKFKGASDYVVYISTSSKGGFKKVTTTKKTVLKIKKIGKKKLQKKKAYYIKVVARKKVGKTVVASTTSKVKVNK